MLTMYYKKQTETIKNLNCQETRENGVSDQGASPSPEEKTLEGKLEELASNNQKETLSYEQRLKGETWFYSRPMKVFLGAVKGFIEQYISFFFTTWPLTSFLMSCGGAALTAALSSNPVTALIIGASFFFGVVGAIHGGRKASDRIEDNEDHVTQASQTLQNLEKIKTINAYLRKETKKVYDELLTKKQSTSVDLTKYRPLILDTPIDETSFGGNKFLPNAKPSRFDKMVDILDRWVLQPFKKLQILFAAWTGSLFGRSLMAAGGLVPLFIPHIGLPALIAVGAVCAAVFVLQKWVDSYHEEKEARDKQLITEAKGNTEAMAAENDYLKQLLVKQRILATTLGETKNKENQNRGVPDKTRGQDNTQNSTDSCTDNKKANPTSVSAVSLFSKNNNPLPQQLANDREEPCLKANYRHYS